MGKVVVVDAENKFQRKQLLNHTLDTEEYFTCSCCRCRQLGVINHPVKRKCSSEYSVFVEDLLTRV